ncbi:caib baif family enzyme [Colletotrichum camelliae]|nr:caib baif family enzyme [Colletotrichum camelliae]
MARFTKQADEIRILTANAMLGYGYKSDHFWFGIHEYRPDAIIIDSGRTDGGPFKLGMGRKTVADESYIRDLTPYITACAHYGMKLLISSAGGDGSDKHVAEILAIVNKIIEDNGFKFKVSTIGAAVPKDLIRQKLKDGKISPCGPVPPLTPEDVDSAVDVVAQMGPEPFIKALQEEKPDIIVAGRSYDPSPFAAFCMNLGVERAPAFHLGKILECGGQCAVPKGRSMIATIRKDSFDLTPLNPIERCTPLSVAAHSLYEKTRPDQLPGPGGVLHLDQAQYKVLEDGRTTRCWGSRFVPTPTYQIKLEGVSLVGHRAIFIGGFRDPVLISQLDDFLENRVRNYTRGLFPELDKSEDCRLIFHVYGRNAIMGPSEPNSEPAHEVGVLGEVVAPTAAKAMAICNSARVSCLHLYYPGVLATTGNFASPLSPHEQDAGAVFKFSLYHLMEIDDPTDKIIFPIKSSTVGAGTFAKDDAFGKQFFNLDNFLNVSPEEIETKSVPTGPATMRDVASVVRSKNSGPFELTFDIMFDDEKHYQRVKKANVLTNETIKKLYQIQDADIVVNMYFDPALAWKCTIKRPWAQGSVGERDTLGTAQHAPLLSVSVPAVGA